MTLVKAGSKADGRSSDRHLPCRTSLQLCQNGRIRDQASIGILCGPIFFQFRSQRTWNQGFLSRYFPAIRQYLRDRSPNHEFTRTLRVLPITPYLGGLPAIPHHLAVQSAQSCVGSELF